MSSFLKSIVYGGSLPLLLNRASARGLTFGISYRRFEVMPHDDPLPGMAVTAERFEQQLEWLREIGEIVSIDEALQFPGQNKIRFFISFDDGYADNAVHLPRLLNRMQVPCTCYITSNFVRGTLPQLAHDQENGYCPSALSETQLRELGAHPMITIGLHSATHPRLNTFDQALWERELLESRKWLESRVEKPVRHFAYPFGQPCDFAWKEGGPFLIDAGFESVASNYGGANRPYVLDKLQKDGRRLTHLRRVPAPNTDDRKIFLAWVLGWANPGARCFATRRLQ